MERSIVTGISFPSDLLKKIDRIRGAMPRSRFVSHLVERGLENLDQLNIEEVVAE